MDPTLPHPVDLSQNRQPDLYASSTIPYVIALSCVTLRFWCRWSKRSGFWLDDWLVLLALAFATGLSADQLWWIPHGLGRHVQTSGPNVHEYWAKSFFTAELTYTGVIVFVKFSILALYWRIFNKNSSIKLPVSILAATVSAWGIAVFLLTLLQCIPTRGYWDKTIKAVCNADSQKFVFGISIPNILLDIILLSLPIPYVVRLNVPRAQKRVLVSIFLLGGFVCIASILLLIAVATESTDADITWNIINHAIWATIEADFAIVSACLPTMRPVWLAIRPKRFSPQPAAACPLKFSPKDGNQKRPPRTWGASLLQPTASEGDDMRPLPSVNGAAEDDWRNGHVPGAEQSQTTVAIPLSDIEARGVQEPRAIRVHNAWNVEYS